MARVQRGNVVLTVKDDEVQRYLQLGYDLTNPAGEVVKSAIPTDYATLQKLYLDHIAKITELENTVAKLTAELTEAKRTNKQSETTKSPGKKIQKQG